MIKDFPMYKNFKKGFIVCFIFIATLFLFVACDGEEVSVPTPDIIDNNRIELSVFINDISSLKDFKTDIDSATYAIGLIEEDFGARDMNQSSDLMLVKIEDENSNPTPVIFEATKDTILNGKEYKAGDVLSQDELAGTIDKLCVLGDYTLISFLTFDLDNLVSNYTYSRNENSSFTYCYGDISLGINNGSISFVFNHHTSDDFRDVLYISYYEPVKTESSTGEISYDFTEYKDEIYLRSDYTDNPAFDELSTVPFYDTYDYYTSMFRQSFIIDNRSGLIYLIPGSDPESEGLNLSVNRGVIIDDYLGPVDLTVNEEDELEITPLLENQTIYIYDAFRDRFGQYYLCCESLNETDLENNVLFYNSIYEYIPTKTGDVIHFEVIPESIKIDEQGVSVKPIEVTGVSYMIENFEQIPIPENAEIEFSYDSNTGLVLHYEDYSFNEIGIRKYNYNHHLTTSPDLFCVYIRCLLLKNNKLYAKDWSYDLSTGSIESIRLPGNISFLLDNIATVLLRKESNNNTYSLYVLEDPFSIDFPYTPYWSDVDYGSKYLNIDGNSVVPEESKRRFYDFQINFADEVLSPYESADFYTDVGTYKNYKYKEGYNYDIVAELYLRSMFGEPLLENISEIEGESRWKVRNGFNMTFVTKTKTGVNKYRIIKNDNGNYEVQLTDASTVSQKVVTLQPINR